MKHLVATFADIPLPDARRQLAEAHDFLVARSLHSLATTPQAGPLWGVQMKRMHVDLKVTARPSAVCKDAERFGEVVNMIATLERLIAALGWFEKHPEFSVLRVNECHPSTSSAKGSNDLMLEDAAGTVVVRCEVSDVASASADSNGKERKDIASLGCSDGVPVDGVRRFLCISPEFARTIQSLKRKWELRPYRYREFAIGDATGTVLVELIPASTGLSKEASHAHPIQ
ncbi:MAG: hypothetical protein JNK76_16845 [Planctomycetales bacterium]|nr:hypothetical protein [Planctomycetales bacterium]MBN8624929.1 hypothetical protein [Planctomycetota bacterium]